MVCYHPIEESYFPISCPPSHSSINRYISNEETTTTLYQVFNKFLGHVPVVAEGLSEGKQNSDSFDQLKHFKTR